MKKIILVIAITSVFVACKEKTSDANTTGAMNTPAIGNGIGAAAQFTAKPVVVQKEVSYTNTSNYPATTKKKKGLSKAAKGTLIGAGSGAVLGAVVSKKHGKGAVVGGVLGGVTGYIIGRNKDKKDGRVH